MPDHTDDGQQPTRRTLTRPPLFTPRVTRSDEPERERAATATRRSSRLFTPPRVPRQTTPPASARAAAPAVPPPLPSELSPAAASPTPAAPEVEREAPATSAGAQAERTPPSRALESGASNAGALGTPPSSAPVKEAAAAVPQTAPPAPSMSSPAEPMTPPSAEPHAPFVVGDIETADIALTASAGSGLIDRGEASIPDADAASAVVPAEPAHAEPRETIGGVDIERPVWTFLPENEGDLPAVELPAMPAEPAEPAELEDAAESPALDGIERSPDTGPWGSAPAQRGSPEAPERLEVDHTWFVQPEHAEHGEWQEEDARAGGAVGDASAAIVGERDAVTQEMNAIAAVGPAAEPPAEPDVASRAEEPAASAAAEEDAIEIVEPAASTSAGMVGSPEEEVDEAWAEATRPDVTAGDAFGDEDALGAPMVEGPRQRYFASQPAPGSDDADITAREVDEMTAALGWPETAGAGLADAAAALPALDAELRASAALFAAAQGEAPAADVAAALERIARRIRDGQVVIPRDAGAASEESALAVTLAALLKGPPRG